MVRKKDLVIAVLVTFCLTVMLFSVIPTLSQTTGQYDPWADLTGPNGVPDGKIDIRDVHYVAKLYGAAGTPLTEAALLYDSGWMNTTDKQGQTITINHNLNIADWNDPSILVDLSGKMKSNGDLIREANARGTPVWNMTFGGPLMDSGVDILQTGDGGFVILALNGTTYAAEDFDAMLIKLDASGNQQWNTSFASPGYDDLRCIIQTSDGGFALAGCKNYYGPGDMWLIKTDASGVEQWNKTYGGPNFEAAIQIIQTSDGGYALAGETGIFYTYYNGYLVKTDADGNVQWTQTYPTGGTWSTLWGVIQRSDGGYMLAGIKNWENYWLIETNSTGDILWDKTYEGSGEPRNFIQTTDGGYALAGFTTSYGAGGNDGWLMKTDADGNAQWNMTWGGPNGDCFNHVVQTPDGGFALTGSTNDTGDPSSSDAMLVKTDSTGNVEWSRTYGGSSGDFMRSLVLTSDGGVAMIGETSSFGAGDRDIWLLRTSLETGLEQVGVAANTMTLYRRSGDPYWNYVRVQIWQRRTP